MTNLRPRIGAALGIGLALGLLAAAPAEARRGGSFGSRGARTYSAPRSTSTYGGYVPPVQRSMTPNSGQGSGGAYAPRPGQPGYAAGGFNGARPGQRFGGFGGGLLGGLVAGGLIGGLMGHGFGGGWGGGGLGGGFGGGLLTILIQLAVVAFAIWMITRWFRRRRPAFASPFAAQQPAFDAGAPMFGGGGFGASPEPAAPYVPTTGPAWEIAITPQDQAAFEALLIQIQEAFGREDYGALRDRCTPEVMSYLAEELSDNATHGKRNEVTGTRLIKADVGEAWREGDIDYATAAMHYESIDLMKDRSSGAVLSGDPNRATQTTELWTFARQAGAAWKLSAIQET
ncbi:TIM44-like domain-containing protein [Phenylobacterium sp.]|uniref:Tim44 domain-containing protein n=1 Tax=Phenylobacterium sp. TaxID=1871053 RepID=UPI00286D5ED4|nr:TIM44-like domain-containing protein [Phenylobacterium sp.]